MQDTGFQEFFQDLLNDKTEKQIIELVLQDMDVDEIVDRLVKSKRSKAK